MYINQETIAKLAQEMQEKSIIQTKNYKEYNIILIHDKTIIIIGNRGKQLSVNTSYISDIHKILQLCHPDNQYYIEQKINLSPNCPQISIYNHARKPNIFSYQQPIKQNNEYYILNTEKINNIFVDINKPIEEIINYITKETKKTLSFIQSYPNIQFKYQHSRHNLTFKYHQLHTKSHIPYYHNLYINTIAEIVHPSIIKIKINITHDTFNRENHFIIVKKLVDIKTFNIHVNDIINIHENYHIHINQEKIEIINNIQQNHSYSQHEKINITRAIIQHLDTNNHHILQIIQHCAEIFRDHFIYIPPISPP